MLQSMASGQAAIDSSDMFAAGSHAADSVTALTDAAMVAKGVFGVGRNLMQSGLNFMRAGMLGMKIGTAAPPPTLIAGLPESAPTSQILASTAASEAQAVASAPAVAVSQAAAQADTFIGTSTSNMRTQAASLIRTTPNHPLAFLLNPVGRFFSSKGLAHSELIDHPEIVQMGHIVSDKAGGSREYVMLQGAWENQLNAISIEHPSKGGAFAENVAIDIGGVAVDRRTAIWWEVIGWLKPGTVASAPPVIIP
jgi:hypothetical protein